MGGADKFKPFSENLLFLDADEPQRGTTYDVILFLGLPSNFDEPRVSRAPWAADQLAAISDKLKGVPLIIVSSLWGGVQADGVVPEEIEFERRKPRTHFEGVCQQYEARILKAVGSRDGKWHFVRLPVVVGHSADGRCNNFSGQSKLLQELHSAKLLLGEQSQNKTLELAYNQDATFWMMPCDQVATLLVKFIEDPSRPTICNMVPSQATLMQEWMHEVSRALEIDAINPVEKDNLNLPSTLRSMLNDNLQIKTRNLFELLGRYHHSPVVLTSDYFAKLINYGLKNNWGQARPSTPELPFSSEKARQYFEQFFPENLDKRMLKALSSFKGGIAFQIAGEETCHWLISYKDNKASVVAFNADSHKPEASFLVNAPSFARLSSGKMMFEQALLTRNLQVNGNPIQSIKACDFFRRFLQRHHFSPALESNGRVLEGAATD